MTRTLEQKATLRCLICGAGNDSQALVCSACAAPMALVQETLAQNRPPRLVSVVGESNVGKTVFLGFLLDMLSQRAGDFEAIPRGPYSVDLQQLVISHMAHRMFPPKTPMEANEWHWAYYQVRSRNGRRNGWIDLVMPDMAGESLAAEVAQPDTFRIIRSLLAQSRGILLLVDAAVAANGYSQPDFFALKITSYIDSMYSDHRERPIETPMAVVLCKGDYCPEVFDDPTGFAEANLNRLWNMCQSRFANVEFFASSVVGSLGYATSPEDAQVVPVPLHTALRGVLEPFEWIIGEL